MLLEHGIVKVGEDWQVREERSAGYSRVYHVYGGEVVYEDENGKTKLIPGQLYIFPSNIPYSIAQDQNDRLSCLFFHIDFTPDIVPNLIIVNLKNDILLDQIIAAIAIAIKGSDSSVLNALVEAFRVCCLSRGFASSVSPEIYGAVRYISENPQLRHSLRELAGRAGYNSQYYIRLFRNHTGMSPHQYVIGCRMKRAKQLLKENISVSEAARLSGYPDIKSFGRAFKKFFGIAPRIFRESNTGQP